MSKKKQDTEPIPTSVLIVNELLKQHDMEATFPVEDKSFLIQLVEEGLQLGYYHGYTDKEAGKKPVIDFEGFKL